jgi:hypothetical protein
MVTTPPASKIAGVNDMRLQEQVEAWLDKMTPGSIDDSDLAELRSILQRPRRQTRQRLLYLHTSGMNVLSQVIAMDLREATRQANRPHLEPEPKIPYNSVHDAIVDGWRVVQFPQHMAPIDDREINFLGYEFILEKLEEYDD